MVVNAPDHPARNVNIENDSVTVGTVYTNPVDVGGDELASIGEALDAVLDQIKLTNALLMEIGK